MSEQPETARQRCVILLGQLDRPTDGVEDYCRYLGQALEGEHCEVQIVRLRWEEIGLAASLRELDEQVGPAPAEWYLLQYTALAWSRRGFSTRAIQVARALKKKSKCAVTFHDYGPYPGNRWIDRLRRIVQIRVLRSLLQMSDVAVLTVPREQMSWIPHGAKNGVFIPVGANLPSPESAWTPVRLKTDTLPVVAVFSISGPPHGSIEVQRIADAVMYASKQVGPLRVIVLGRNSETGGEELRAALAGSAVEVTVLGIVPGEDVVRTLSSSDVLLFARGPISSNRGSAIAGIACGLPVIAQQGSVTSPLIAEAGVVLVPEGQSGGFGPALVRVLTDSANRATLVARSKHAQTQYFSWTAIAAQYAKALREVTDKTLPSQAPSAGICTPRTR